MLSFEGVGGGTFMWIGEIDRVKLLSFSNGNLKHTCLNWKTVSVHVDADIIHSKSQY